MNIQKKLSLNKHPGDCVPYSLVAAKNVKVSNDERMIVNEEGLEDCKVIANAIHEDGINNFKIVGVIPIKKKRILFLLVLNLFYLLLILILIVLIFIDIMNKLIIVIE